MKCEWQGEWLYMDRSDPYIEWRTRTVTVDRSSEKKGRLKEASPIAGGTPYGGEPPLLVFHGTHIYERTSTDDCFRHVRRRHERRALHVV